MNRWARPRRQGSRLAARLVVLVLVPLTALGVQTVRTATNRSHTATRTAAVESRADVVRSVMRLCFALMDEEVVDLAVQQAGERHVTFAELAGVLGYGDARAWQQSVRATTDSALAGLPASAGLGGIRAEVTASRAAIEAGTYADADGARLVAAQTRVEDRARQLAVDLATASQKLSGGSAALRDAVALQLTYQAALLRAALGADLFDLAGGQGTIAQAKADLVRHTAQYSAIAGEISIMGSVTVRASWNRILTSAGAREFDALIATAVSSGQAPSIGAPGRDGQQSSLSELGPSAAIYRKALDRREIQYRLVYQAADVVAADLESMRETADDSYRQSLIEILVVGLLALLGVWFLSRGVTRPLADIADRARRISDGDLAVDTRRRRRGGHPREVTAVVQAFDDVAANLRLVEDQASALADGDTGNEALRRRLPGRLGASLQLSVARLSASLADREQLESRLRHEATHDRLTGLLNRASAIVALEQGVARAQRTGSSLAVLMVDLDGLKRVNEAGGHATGDEILRRAAGKLLASVRAGDIVARLGADEFAVVAEVDGIGDAVDLGRRVVTDLAAISAEPAATGPATDSVTGSVTDSVTGSVTGSVAGSVAGSVPGSVADSVIAALPVQGGRTGGPIPVLTVGASVGIALTLDGRATPAALLRDADTAVHRAKDGGGGRVEVFDEELRRQLAERTTIEAALTAAMARGDLRLCYQPIVDPAGRLRGLEALCRWTDPVLGEVSPAIFVPVAEASDLVVDLDRWVLREATGQLAAWHAEGRFTDVYLSVNLSGRHLLGPDVVDDVRTALAESGVNPRSLVLEITETVLLDDLLVAAQHLSEVRAFGVRLAVDDFGTGYTSIAHLQRLPIDILKIDRSFVVDMTGERGRSLVRLMIDMAATLGLGVVAEGVETGFELEQLRRMNCPLVQGFLTGRPMLPEALAYWSDTMVVASTT